METNDNQPLGYLIVPKDFFYWLAFQQDEELRANLATFCQCITTENFSNWESIEIIKLAKSYTEYSRKKLYERQRAVEKAVETRKKNQEEKDSNK